MKNIIFVGMPCSGKTTIGEKISNTLNLDFIDTDKLIECKENNSIKGIFLCKGEKYFRKLELALIENLIKKCTLSDNLVISVGGGLPMFNHNMDKLNKIGITIFLDASIDVLLERAKYSYERQILEGNTREKIALLYKERISIYTQSDIRINVSNIDSDSLCKEILSIPEIY